MLNAHASTVEDFDHEYKKAKREFEELVDGFRHGSIDLDDVEMLITRFTKLGSECEQIKNYMTKEQYEKYYDDALQKVTQLKKARNMIEETSGRYR